MSFVTDLDSGLLKLSPHDSWTMRDAVRGLHFWGSIGAGKTTAAQMVAGAFLRAGCGGYITAVKPTEIELWQRYAAQHGRSNSLILFDGETETFNFLDYLMATHGMDGIGSVTDCLMTVIDAARRASATASQRGGEAFWEDSARQALRFALPPIFSAKGSITIPDIIAFITSAPMNLKEPADPNWKARSAMFKIINDAEMRPRVPMARAALKSIVDFWQYEFPAIPDKTRGNICITITSALDRFRHGRLQRAFCSRTTLVPELSFSGSVIVDCKPTTIWNEDGVIGQSLFKFLWQRCVLRRNSLAKNHQERFLFQWSDESQETVSPHDSAFLSLCRDSKCCVTYLTQSLPTYFAKIGGDNPKDSAMALATKFGSHVFCSNLLLRDE